MTATTSNTTEEPSINALYARLLDCWNRRDAVCFAELFDEDSQVIGFDGSQMSGRAEIEATLGQIFAHHETAAYVGKVRGVRFLAPDVAVLRAVVGMVPPGQTDINPAVNALQTLIAVKREIWRIALFQNTPAQFHGRPDLSAALSEELRGLLRT